VTATLIRRSLAVEGHPASLFDDLGGEPTLDELLVGVWEGLTAHSATACPACAGRMEPEYGPHSRPIGGRCRSCGSTLS
jgi:hypothetical protein